MESVFTEKQDKTITAPEKIKVDDVELKTIELRLNSVKEATQRSRAVFLIMTVTCAMILFGLWNAVVSWDRGLSTQARSSDSTVAANQKAVTEEWFKNLVVSVSPLGIRVSVNDLAVIGSSTLVVIMVWFFFCQRRENRAIVSLLQYCNRGGKNKQLSEDVCNLVYEGIVQSIVFIDMGGGDEPIEGLEVKTNNHNPTSTNENPNPDSNEKTNTENSNIKQAEETKKSQQTSFIRKILTLLAYLPPITISLIVISDMVTIFLLDSYVRDGFAKLYTVLGNFESGKVVGNIVSIAKIIAFEIFAISCCAYTYIVCSRCRKFSKATANTINRFKEDVLKTKD